MGGCIPGCGGGVPGAVIPGVGCKLVGPGTINPAFLVLPGCAVEPWPVTRPCPRGSSLSICSRSHGGTGSSWSPCVPRGGSLRRYGSQRLPQGLLTVCPEFLRSL